MATNLSDFASDNAAGSRPMLKSAETSKVDKPLRNPLAVSLETPVSLQAPLPKATQKSFKASRDFYQKNTNAIAVIAAVILGAGMQNLLENTDDYNTAENLLFMVCILEGLCLFFSNLIMMVK